MSSASSHSSVPPLASRLAHAFASAAPTMTAVLPGVALALLHSTMLDVPSADLIDAIDTDRYRIHWISGSYLLGSALGMALTGFCGHLLGLRGAYLLGLAMFSLIGAACGLVNEIIWMAPLRFGQGLGNGLTISVGMVLVWRALPTQRAFAMAMYGMAVYVPAMLGVVLGGLLTTWFDWRWIFFLLAPLGLTIWAVAWWLLPAVEACDPDPRTTEPKQNRFDLFGFALLATWIAAMNVALDMGQYWGWQTSRHFVIWAGLFLVAFSTFVGWGLTARHPLINLRVFGRRNTTLGLGIKALFSINVLALASLLTLYMVNLRGYQWWQTGLVFLPAAGMMAIGIAVGIAVGRPWNRRWRMFTGLAVMIAATAQLTVLDVYTSKFWLAGVLSVWGAGAGIVIGPALITIFEGLELPDAMQMAGVFNILRSQPAFVATVTLATFWTQDTDAYFDFMRQDIHTNRPVVTQSYRTAQSHFITRGSPHQESVKQSHALVRKWTHANARAFALQVIMRDLAWLTAPALVLVLFVRRADGSAMGGDQENDSSQAIVNR
jgi:DHA2 family multidrug resistance protein